MFSSPGRPRSKLIASQCSKDSRKSPAFEAVCSPKTSLSACGVYNSLHRRTATCAAYRSEHVPVHDLIMCVAKVQQLNGSSITDKHDTCSLPLLDRSISIQLPFLFLLLLSVSVILTNVVTRMEAADMHQQRNGEKALGLLSKVSSGTPSRSVQGLCFAKCTRGEKKH